MGEYVYGDSYGSHSIDQGALVAAGGQAISKAASMVRHWVLEKHYNSQFPHSRLARSFGYRGISGTEFEQVYANYFFNFYLTAMNEDFQYLPAFLLVNKSPLLESASLDKARALIAQVYDYY